MIKIAALVIVVVLAGWWITTKNDAVVAPAADSTESTTGVGETSGTPDQATAAAPVAITISGSEFKYEPAAITVNIGQPVTVTYTNVGKYPHDFVIDELSVKSQVIKSGETGTFTFTPTKSGTFAFYCSLPNHLERGMKGSIIVN